MSGSFVGNSSASYDSHRRYIRVRRVHQIFERSSKFRSLATEYGRPVQRGVNFDFANIEKPRMRPR